MHVSVRINPLGIEVVKLCVLREFLHFVSQRKDLLPFKEIFKSVQGLCSDSVNVVAVI